MIVKGTFQSDRPDLNGKPYTLDFDRDFLHMTLHDRPVAFSDYFPRKGAPNEYIIADFDKDGRFIGVAFEGLLSEWAHASLKNRIMLFGLQTRINAQSLALASRVFSEIGKRVIEKSVPQVNARGQLPAYAP
jgi:hypothetical protein